MLEFVLEFMSLPKVTTYSGRLTMHEKYDKYFASLGKIIAFLGIVVALILGVFQIIDRFQTPSVYGVGEIRDYYLNPKIRESFDSRIRKDEIITSIEELKKKGNTPSQILEVIKKSDFPAKSPFHGLELDQYAAFSPKILEFTIYNTGSDIARDVRLMLPGEGTAEICEQMAMTVSSPKRIDWVKDISLGDIRPQGVLRVLVWPKLTIAPNLSYIKPALIHSKGYGKIMEQHCYYGWGSDLAAWWFLSLGQMARIFLISVVVLIFGSLLNVACKRGYIVFKPKNNAD
jgi:hypothetical protein